MKVKCTVMIPIDVTIDVTYDEMQDCVHDDYDMVDRLRDRVTVAAKDAWDEDYWEGVHSSEISRLEE